MNECPICDSTLVREHQQGSEWGLEEYRDVCPVSYEHYVEDFNYGSNQVYIGRVVIGWGYNDNSEIKQDAQNLIRLVSEYYLDKISEPIVNCDEPGVVRYEGPWNEARDDAEAYCGNCDEHLDCGDDDWKYCPNCGIKLIWPSDIVRGAVALDTKVNKIEWDGETL